MMTKGHNLWHYAAMWLLALTGSFMVSCSTAVEDITPDVEPTQVHVTFTMSLSANSNSTRASQQETGNWGDYSPYQTANGNEFENTVNNLQVAICDKTGGIIGVVNNIKMYGQAASSSATTTNTESTEYVVQGTWTPTADDLAKANEGGKVMVFANCNDITKDTKLDELSFSNNDIASKGIPMWGIKKIERNFELGLSNNLEEIKLLRAVSKVSVKCGYSTDGYELTDVTLHNYNVNGYVLPTYTYSSTDKTEDITFANSIHENTTDFSANSTTFGFTDVSESDTMVGTTTNVLYLPEYVNKNKTKESNVSYIEFYFTNGTQKKGPFTIEFADYEEGNKGTPKGETLHDILRNHYYDFTVNYYAGKVEITAEVNPWWKVDSEVSWDVNGAVMWAWNTKADENPKTNATTGDAEALYCLVNNPRYQDNAHTKTQDGSSGAAFSFTLNKTEQAVVWKAYLTNTTDFQFNHGKSTDATNCVSIGTSREGAYQIKVEATTPWSELQRGKRSDYGVYTDLYIVAEYGDGRCEVVTINPKDTQLTKTYWNDSRRFAGGTYKQTVQHNGQSLILGDGQWIRIWQVEAKLNNAYDKLAEAIANSDDASVYSNASKKSKFWKGN